MWKPQHAVHDRAIFGVLGLLGKLHSCLYSLLKPFGSNLHSAFSTQQSHDSLSQVREDQSVITQDQSVQKEEKSGTATAKHKNIDSETMQSCTGQDVVAPGLPD